MGTSIDCNHLGRLTGDVDLCYEQDATNVDRLLVALVELWGGAVPGGSEAAESMVPNVVVQFGRPPHRVDLIGRIDGVGFADAWSSRVREGLELGDARSVDFPVTGVDHLLRNERASGRHQDLADVDCPESQQRSAADL